MKESDALIEFKDGIELLKNGYANEALPHLRRAVEIESQNPYYLSFFGLATARAEKKWTEASHLCETALQLKGKEPQFHLNLAEVYTAAGKRASAIATLERAIENFGPTARLTKARSRIEKRQAPVLSFLKRDHMLNKSLGKLRHRAAKRVVNS
ncbi:MAG: tetratricopeptide repeat protein [Candidatus Acidiferrales bacterium]